MHCGWKSARNYEFLVSIFLILNDKMALKSAILSFKQPWPEICSKFVVITIKKLLKKKQ